MFETLHTIDWSHVESCYGTSEEIPAAIRGLVSAEASVRDFLLLVAACKPFWRLVTPYVALGLLDKSFLEPA